MSATYASALVKKYKGKKVEILFDSDWGQRLYAEVNINNKAVVIGTIIDSDAICLNVEVEVETANRKYKRIISINSWQILSVSFLLSLKQVRPSIVL